MANTNQNTKWWRIPDWWIVIFTCALAVFATASFVVLWIQVNDAREAFVKDQRPYIWLASGPGNLSLEIVDSKQQTGPHKQIVVTVQYTNFGRSPAIDLRSAKDFETGTDAREKVKLVPLMPAKNIVPPNKVDVFSLVTSPLSDQEISDLMKDFQMAFLARFQYSDLSGHRYESHLCMEHLQVGNWMYCETNNKIKNCQQEKCEP
jgi:hypothetical protein